MKDEAGHLTDDERKKSVYDAEEGPEGETEAEAKFIRRDVAEEPAIWPRGSAEGLPNRELGGFRFTHNGDAAEADSSASIALITPAVEMRFIGIRGWSG